MNVFAFGATADRSETPSVLVAHNIDLAPRIARLVSGDTVEFEWNEKAGVIHWTHEDPANQHVAGWLEHDGQVFQ